MKVKLSDLLAKARCPVLHRAVSTVQAVLILLTRLGQTQMAGLIVHSSAALIWINVSHWLQLRVQHHSRGTANLQPSILQQAFAVHGAKLVSFENRQDLQDQQTCPRDKQASGWMVE